MVFIELKDDAGLELAQHEVMDAIALCWRQELVLTESLCLIWPSFACWSSRYWLNFFTGSIWRMHGHMHMCSAKVVYLNVAIEFCSLHRAWAVVLLCGQGSEQSSESLKQISHCLSLFVSDLVLAAALHTNDDAAFGGIGLRHATQRCALQRAHSSHLDGQAGRTK